MSLNINPNTVSKIQPYQILIDELDSFLYTKTPIEWIELAASEAQQPILLIDHMICELKAAQTAAWLVRKYAVDQESGELILQWLEPYENYIYKKEGSLETLSQSKITKKLKLKDENHFSEDLLDKMITLIKEELHHFYQVLSIMESRNVEYKSISAGRYAKGLMRAVRTHEPATLIDKLICGAYIEARSCERFARLAPYVDEELADFFISLLRSEARHYQDYLELASQIANEDISSRIQSIGETEANLIQSSDLEFRFHSGVPCSHS